MNLRRVSFQEGLLGNDPCQVPILYFKDHLLALLKPRNVLIAPHSWYPKFPVLSTALRAQILEGNYALKELNIHKIHAIHQMDPELTGVALLGTSEEKTSEIKNVAGSGMMTFEFLCALGDFADTASPKQGWSSVSILGFILFSKRFLS